MKTDIRNIIGSNMRSSRISMGISQKQLAESVGNSSASYISFIERGERNIFVNDLVIIGMVLGVSIGWLIKDHSNTN